MQRSSSFQIAARTLRLEEPVLAGWIDVPLDSLTDLVASKMNALVSPGAGYLILPMGLRS